jgi:hypothetical protein
MPRTAGPRGRARAGRRARRLLRPRLPPSSRRPARPCPAPDHASGCDPHAGGHPDPPADPHGSPVRDANRRPSPARRTWCSAATACSPSRGRTARASSSCRPGTPAATRRWHEPERDRARLGARGQPRAGRHAASHAQPAAGATPRPTQPPASAGSGCTAGNRVPAGSPQTFRTIPERRSRRGAHLRHGRAHGSRGRHHELPRREPGVRHDLRHRRDERDAQGRARCSRSSGPTRTCSRSRTTRCTTATSSVVAVARPRRPPARAPSTADSHPQGDDRRGGHPPSRDRAASAALLAAAVWIDQPAR